jgi:hypothetical protein
VGRLYGALVVLGLIFSVAVALLTAGIYTLDWVWAAVGGIVGIVFLGLGGLLVPPARKAVPDGWEKMAGALLQFFGAFCTAEVMIMAIIGWVVGNRSYNQSLGYEVLGILLFLGLVGIGIQGLIGTFIRFLYVRYRILSEQRALRAAEEHDLSYPHGAAHT